MDCERLEMCSFYNDKLPMTHGLGLVYKKKYCKGNHNVCARYLIFKTLGADAVPSHLYPNMLDVAELMIAKSKEE